MYLSHLWPGLLSVLFIRRSFNCCIKSLFVVVHSLQMFVSGPWRFSIAPFVRLFKWRFAGGLKRLRVGSPMTNFSGSAHDAGACVGYFAFWYCFLCPF